MAPSPFAERVLAVVEQVPPGAVLSYGDVAELVGSGSPRAVGQVLRRHGHEVPWHRVVQASGAPARHKGAPQLALLHADGTPLLPGGERVDMARARWCSPEPIAASDA